VSGLVDFVLVKGSVTNKNERESQLYISLQGGGDALKFRSLSAKEPYLYKSLSSKKPYN